MPDALGLMHGILPVASADGPTVTVAPALFLDIVVKPSALGLKLEQRYRGIMTFMAFTEAHPDVADTATLIKRKVNEG